MGITQAVEIANIVVLSVDSTEFYPDHIYVPVGNDQLRVVRQHDNEPVMYITESGRNRIVGRDVVIANLYRYNVEQFAVIIRDGRGSLTNPQEIARFDLDTERGRVQWLLNERTVRERVDAFLSNDTRQINGQWVRFRRRKCYSSN